jgi:hypothetical protein
LLWRRHRADPIRPGGVVPVVVAVAAHAGLVAVVGETVGNVGIDELSPSVPTRGNTFGNGTGGVEPTPRLPISNDPNGIPVRAPPPGVVGVVDVGLDDAATLLEPEPHIPDIPDVSSTPADPEVTGISDVTEVVDDVDVPDAVVVPDIAVSPELAAVAGTAVPTDMPPPSKLAVDPNISEGGVAAVGHAVLVVAVGIVIVPVTPVGTGLTPGVVIPTAPSGIPVGELVEPIAMASGEVAPTVGVGVTVPSNCPSTCAMAALQTTSAGRTAAIIDSLAVVLLKLVERDFAMLIRWPAWCDDAPSVSIGFATSSPGAELSDIGQSPVLWSMLTPEARSLPTRFAQNASDRYPAVADCRPLQ